MNEGDLVVIKAEAEVTTLREFRGLPCRVVDADTGMDLRLAPLRDRPDLRTNTRHPFYWPAQDVEPLLNSPLWDNVVDW